MIIRTWKTTHDDEVEVWFAPATEEYRWRARAANGEIVGQGEGHPELSDAVSAAERHHPPVASGA